MSPAGRNMGKCSTCSEERFSLARLNLIRQSCVVHRETFVQLGKSFRGGATIPGTCACYKRKLTISDFDIGLHFLISLSYYYYMK